MSEAWQVFDIPELVRLQNNKDVSFKEVFKTRSMHCGIYHLKAGSQDMQTPHDEDEVYYVLSGRAKLRVGNSTEAVTPGKLLFVQASEEHTFFEIQEDMTLLVLFA